MINQHWLNKHKLRVNKIMATATAIQPNQVVECK